MKQFVLWMTVIACVAGGSAWAEPAGAPSHIDESLAKAWLHMRAGDYKDAVALCDGILAEQEHNREAINLRFMAENLMNATDRAQAQKTQVTRSEAEVIKAIEKNQPEPEKEPLQRRPVIEVPDPDAAMRARVEEKLAQKVSLDLVDADLAYLLNLLFRTNGINIIADQSILASALLNLRA